MCIRDSPSTSTSTGKHLRAEDTYNGSTVTTLTHVDEPVGSLEYWQDDDGILAATEEVVLEVCLDSGAVAMVLNPNDLPAGCETKSDKPLRHFVGANGSKIENYGKATTMLGTDDNTNIECLWQVADVTRPLHATSGIADSDFEILYTKSEATVVPAGTLSKYMDSIATVAKYPRKGGLYIAEMKAKAPGSGPSFTRQGGAGM